MTWSELGALHLRSAQSTWRGDSPRGATELGRSALRGSAALMIGLLAGGVVAAAGSFDPQLAVVVAAVLLVLPIVLLRPDLGTCAFLLALFLLEEFPSGQGETVERSTRLPFYSLSLGVPGLYATDVLLFGLLAVFLVRALLARRANVVPLDRFTLALLALSSVVLIAVVSSFLFGDPLAEGRIRHSSGTLFKVNDRGAMLIAFFQLKIFAYLFASYLLGLFYLDAPRRVGELSRLLLFASLVAVVIGAVRLAGNPGMLGKGYPLFYHTPSSWMFAFVAFYLVLAICSGELSRARSVQCALLAAVLGFFVLASFRRTMWAAVALASVLLWFYLPPRMRTRVLTLGALLGALGLLLFLSPLAESLRASVLQRVAETGTDDTSTLYRLSVADWMSEHWLDIPPLGYGVTPLWNKTLAVGARVSNLENVHSLYFWLLLRTGPLGLAVSLSALAVMFAGAVRLSRRVRDPQRRRVAICIVLAVFLVLFSGAFNPVYAEARYLIYVGFGFALASRIGSWERLEDHDHRAG